MPTDTQVTGACAAAGVAYKLGLTGNKVIVHMPGGELQVEIDDDWNVYMTGDVFYVAKIRLSNEFTEKKEHYNISRKTGAVKKLP